jgi:hypothetical protein
MAPIHCPKTLVTNYKPTLQNIPEKLRPNCNMSEWHSQANGNMTMKMAALSRHHMEHYMNVQRGLIIMSLTLSSAMGVLSYKKPASTRNLAFFSSAGQLISLHITLLRG